VFRRTDLEGDPEVPARVDRIIERQRRSVLESDGASIETVEHCLSACAAMGLDNATIDLDGPELPACDGSAMPFVHAIHQGGLVDQEAEIEPLVIHETVTVRDGDASVTAMPTDEPTLEMHYVLDFGFASPIAPQVHSYTLDPATYEAEIGPARTFSTRADAEAMWEAGLFRHLTPADMLVIGEAGPIDNTLRFPDEPVRHKLVDLLGDISLVGRPIHGRIVAMRSGHGLNHRLARRLLETEEERGRRAIEVAEPAMNIRSIMGLLPHRYPMILVDRVLEIEGDQRAVGIKNVTINEPFFQGHYPSAPIMPGVLIIEAMCQLAGLMLSQKLERTGKIAILLSLDRVKLRRSVTPGDQLVMETEAVRTSSKFGDVQCRSFVGGQLAAEARVKFMMIDAEERP
jgi:UDP-3-O-[3-hydroxymyristoyl] N-acetylglucosamine deacetylase/3-hydroxyacyl-[acyl-carrier-protein] dehydratase